MRHCQCKPEARRSSPLEVNALGPDRKPDPPLVPARYHEPESAGAAYSGRFPANPSAKSGLWLKARDIIIPQNPPMVRDTSLHAVEGARMHRKPQQLQVEVELHLVIHLVVLGHEQGLPDLALKTPGR